jgi:hypothetical protein
VTSNLRGLRRGGSRPRDKSDADDMLAAVRAGSGLSVWHGYRTRAARDRDGYPRSNLVARLAAARQRRLTVGGARYRRRSPGTGPPRTLIADLPQDEPGEELEPWRTRPPLLFRSARFYANSVRSEMGCRGHHRMASHAFIEALGVP